MFAPPLSDAKVARAKKIAGIVGVTTQGDVAKVIKLAFKAVALLALLILLHRNQIWLASLLGYGPLN